MRAPLEPLSLLSPTPLERADYVSRATGAEVWVKRDDLTNPLYGGNKVRKLAWVLADALAEGATDVLTIGAAGSHHALATGLFGAREGLRVHVVVMPQPTTPHVLSTLFEGVGAGVRYLPVEAQWQGPARMLREYLALRRQGRRVYVVGPGASNVVGSLGYADAVREVAEQLRSSGLAGPSRLFCPLGSGGTAAGLLAGLAYFEVDLELHGVCVTPPWMVSSSFVKRLARGTLRAKGSRARLPPLHLDASQLGRGYGWPTESGDEATELFARDGIHLDPTYTAKTAAALLASARREPSKRYLFWHTLSSAPEGPLLERAPASLPEGLERVLR